jgi:hypothetical protein
MGLAEQPVPRSYHLQDNDWTPLSQNPCWKATIYPLSVFTRSDRLRPNTIFSRLSGTESDKSFVDDSDGTGYCTCESRLVLRSTEIKPLFRDLWLPQTARADLRSKENLASHPPQTTHNTKQHKQKNPSTNPNTQTPITLMEGEDGLGIKNISLVHGRDGQDMLQARNYSYGRRRRTRN